MDHIKFRQPIFNKQGIFLYWHYWGFIEDGRFTGPETNSSTIERAKTTSQIFIGIQDKNGKDIYEGDVTPDGTVEYCKTLNWDSGGSTHPGFYPDGAYDYDERGDLSYHSRLDEDTEVIGNIYENPDLVPAR